jgi:hypothetical protein
MTRKSITDLTAQATASFPDNNTGLITPALLRQFCLDFLDTMRPAYGGMRITAPAVAALGLVYIPVVYTEVIPVPTADYVSVPLTGVITWQGNSKNTAIIQFSCDVEAPNNSITTFALFVDGIETAWAISNTSTSATDKQSYAFSAIASPETLAAAYQVRVKSNGVNNVTLSNGAFVVQNLPRNVS